MTETVAQDWISGSWAQGYVLHDSGHGVKLETISGHKVIRPCPQALWQPRAPQKLWDKAASICHRSDTGGGHWEHKSEPGSLQLQWQALRAQLRFTSFGHCGVFFEQAPVWQAIHDRISRLKDILGRAPRFVNLFGYTGCASIVAAAAGAEVFHIDSARGVLSWGKDNAALSGIPADRIKWIHEHAPRFLELSAKKSYQYDGILADPPSWGHGKKKEKWTFETDLTVLVNACMAVLNPQASFYMLSCHTHGVQEQALLNVVRDGLHAHKCDQVFFQHGELGVAHERDERVLPAGIYTLTDIGALVSEK